MAAANSAVYPTRYAGLSEPCIQNGIYRVLLLISSRDMKTGRVVESTGSRNWQYVWEQEFQDYGAWIKPYMAHPYPSLVRS